MKKLPFLKVEPAFLKAIAAGNIRTPSLYYHPNVVLRESFWLRLRIINQQMARLNLHGGRCLDLETRDAAVVVERHRLGNVTIEQTDISAVDHSGDPFDAIVAADVLEHFKDLVPPISAIQRWLKPDGLLFTSLPTENWVYRLLRTVFGVEQPEDHYHTAYQVEAALRVAGFVAVHRSYLPLMIPFAPLFLVTAWRRYARELNNG
jgi:SAM-dependent methyltransferase